MRELNKMELEVVSGGLCEGLGVKDCLQDAGGIIPREIGNFFAGMNGLGNNFGSWLYDAINC